MGWLKSMKEERDMVRLSNRRMWDHHFTLEYMDQDKPPGGFEITFTKRGGNVV